ncbi:hypothetical protein PR048_024862 [Dryococelus australis]|uniref:Uncharacterized protein n=1 Tax=Dryococelus australis TaxID=614101 RepID=A0ABQ9GPQ4_9NEOP|nr:hypothetical protein PR048_024862 [Dryococelus australis]
MKGRGETGHRRENPPTSGIVRHESLTESRKLTPKGKREPGEKLGLAVLGTRPFVLREYVYVDAFMFILRSRHRFTRSYGYHWIAFEMLFPTVSKQFPRKCFCQETSHVIKPESTPCAILGDEPLLIPAAWRRHRRLIPVTRSKGRTALVLRDLRSTYPLLRLPNPTEQHISVSILAAVNIEVLRATGEKTRRPAASSVTIPTCEDPEIESGSPRAYIPSASLSPGPWLGRHSFMHLTCHTPDLACIRKMSAVARLRRIANLPRVYVSRFAGVERFGRLVTPTSRESVRVRQGVHEATPECRAEGNGRSPRKPGDHRHRPARSPSAKIRKRPRRVRSLTNYTTAAVSPVHSHELCGIGLAVKRDLWGQAVEVNHLTGGETVQDNGDVQVFRRLRAEAPLQVSRPCSTTSGRDVTGLRPRTENKFTPGTPIGTTTLHYNPSPRFPLRRKNTLEECVIAAKRKILNRRVVFSSHCVYLWDFPSLSVLAVSEEIWAAFKTEVLRGEYGAALECKDTRGGGGRGNTPDQRNRAAQSPHAKIRELNPVQP